MNSERTEYRYSRYGFRSNVPLISNQDQLLSYFDNKFDNIEVDCNCECKSECDCDCCCEEIKEAITNTLNENLNEKFCEVHHHIEDAKQTLCCKICCAKKDIERHIDDTVETINFAQNFSDLNQQVQEILEKLG